MARSDNWLVLDTETTGLDQTAEIVQIGIVDAAGRVLVNQLVRPSGVISAEATAVHGLDAAALANAPAWPDLFQEVEQLLAGRQVLAYNAEFDENMLQQTCRRYSLPTPAIQGWVCVMELCAAHWAEIRGDGFRYQFLGAACAQQGIRQFGPANDAAGDALLTWQPGLFTGDNMGGRPPR